ncbi:MAG: trigger factor [Eubacteriales bacterium]
MSVTLIKATKAEAVFQIEIDGGTIEKALIAEYYKATALENKKSAPAFLSNEELLRQYPELDKLSQRVLDKLLPSYYMSAINELGVHPIMFPNIMPKATKLGEPCVIDVRVVLEPEIELKQFEGLEAIYTPVVVTEEDLEQQMLDLRKKHGAENDDSKLLEKLSFDSIEKLGAEIRSSFTVMAKEKTDYNRKEAVMKQLLDANPFTIREEIIQEQVMIEINKIQKQMGQQAMQNYMKATGRSMDDLKKEVRPQVEATVKTNLILKAVADRISPEVTEKDIEEAISQQSGPFMDPNVDYETRRKRFDEMPGAIDQIKHNILVEKATAYIVDKAIVHENKPTNIMGEIPEYMK